MEKVKFSAMEIDALGEMMNISLGSSATAVSNMLAHRVDITTPQVSVVNVEDFQLGSLEPAMGVKIRYVEGLDGSNIMLLRRSDVKVIVDILMGSETSEEEFELNELTISAVCEVMNQMMGAAATAMSEFLGFLVNISTPEPFDLDSLENFKERNLPKGADAVVIVSFSLKIEDVLESEFMNVMSVSLAKELLRGLGLIEEDEEPEPEPEPTPAPAADSNRQMSQEEIEKMLAGMGGGAEPEPEPAADSNRMMSQDEIEKMLAGMGGGAEPEPEPAADSNRQMSQEEIEKMLAGMGGGAEPTPTPTPTPTPAPTPAAQPSVAPTPMQQQMPAAPQMTMTPEAMMQQMQQMQQMFANMNPYMGFPPMYYPYPQQMTPPPAPPTPEPEPEPKKQKPKAEPKVITTHTMQEMDSSIVLGKEQAENLDLIMDVPLQVTVEIGRTRRKVQDILEFSKGSLVVLDKLAGDQVDLFVNGKCVAKGDVVVVDDNFGVRITEVLQNPVLEAVFK